MTGGTEGPGGGGGAGEEPIRRTTASDRFLRLLTVVPWIAAHNGPRLDEVYERFGMTRKQLLDDLQIIPLVGLPPYTPDTLIEVTIEGDRVWLRFADVFARPLRLTPEQGLALVAAGSALRGLPGADPDGPLATALGKVAAVLDVDPDEAISVALGKIRLDVLDTLRQATRERRRVRLDYYAYGRDERRSRTVDPYAVFADEGAWYVRGHCHLAGGERLFRVDRIYGIEVLDEGFEVSGSADVGGPGGSGGPGGPGATREAEVFTPGPDVPRVTLDLAPAARWVVETYPVEDVREQDEGRILVRLAVSATPWLQRLLLRLGPDARVVEADDATLHRAGRDAARRLLGRYGRSGSADDRRHEPAATRQG
jgi:proteasome accessory factor C